MGVIRLSPERRWFAAGWAFRAFLEYAKREPGVDEAVVEVLTRSIALDGLHLDMCEPAVGQRLRRILERTAEGVLRGAFPPVTVEGRTLDQTSQQQFAEAVRELLEMLRRGMES